MAKTKEQWLEEAENYAQAEQYKESIEAINEAIELDPEDAELYCRRGSANEGLKRYGRAIADYGQAIELEPYSPSFYKARGYAYYEVKQYQKAIADFGEAIELTDSSYDLESLHEKIGDAYVALEDYDNARDAYTECAEISRRNYHSNWEVAKKLAGLALYQYGKDKGYL